MYFRFGVALALVVGISLCGIAIERTNLRMRQQITRQHYRMDVLGERIVQARAETGRLGAPERLLEQIEDGRIVLIDPTSQSPRTALSSPTSRH